MTVRWNLIDRQRDGLNPSRLTNDKPAALVHGDATAQVRQSERCLSVASVGSADEIEERVILRDGQQLSLAKRPPLRRSAW